MTNKIKRGFICQVCGSKFSNSADAVSCCPSYDEMYICPKCDEWHYTEQSVANCCLPAIEGGLWESDVQKIQTILTDAGYAHENPRVMRRICENLLEDLIPGASNPHG